MYRIGIDLGGTNIAAGIVNESYEIICQESVPTGADRSSEAIADDMAALCRSVCVKAGIPETEIASVGIASPGIANHDDGVIEYSCNLPFRKFPICAYIRERFPAPYVFVENDANAAAWGEAVAGAARGTHNSVMITLGTGVGGGIIIDDKVYSGFNYAGAELGHIVIVTDGEPCGCGRHGCWEAYSSATALIRMTARALDAARADGRQTLMEDMVAKAGKISGRTAFDAMRAGDAAAREKLIRHNLRLVAHIVKKYYALPGDQEDLVSIGTIGLVKAVDTFDATRKAFPTRATACWKRWFRSSVPRCTGTAWCRTQGYALPN